MYDQFLLIPETFRLDGGAMFGIIPRPLWLPKTNCDSQNRILLSLRLWLIQTEERIVLIDTGIGQYRQDPFNQRFDVSSSFSKMDETSSLAKALAQINITPSKVTDVVLSHLHFDHVGGLTSVDESGKFTSLFKNATLHLHKEHFDYSLKPTARDSGSFENKYFGPCIDYHQNNDLIKWHRGKQGELISELNLKFICSNGHTPHLMHPYNDKFIYLADIIPTSHHINLPWVMGYDIHPGQSVKDKEEILAFCHDKNLTVILEHDPDFWGADILHDKEKNKYYGEIKKEKISPVMKIS